MVGAAIVRRLQDESCEILTVEHSIVDLTRQCDVEKWLRDNQPDVVIIAAAKVGGIHANSALPGEFIYNNLMIEANIIHASYLNKVEKLLFLGSSCIYPKNTPQPIKEEQLLTGELEETNEWYAVAKIAGIKMCQAYRRQYGCDFISIMPTNLYGPGDNFHSEYSHVPAALLKKMHEAKIEERPSVEVWGTGYPLREFLHVYDLSDACIHVLKNYSEDNHINVGTGSDISIADFAEMIRSIVGYNGRIIFDPSRPDGSPRKLLDVSKLKELNWRPQIVLNDGLAEYYQWYLDNQSFVRQ